MFRWTSLNVEENNDSQLVKPEARRFFKIKFSQNRDVIVKFVIVPQWYNDNSSGTKYFNLVEAGEIFKFMSVEKPFGFSREELGAAHCEQTTRVPIY